MVMLLLRYAIRCLLLAMFFLVFLPSQVNAAPDRPLDMVIVIDQSGSMYQGEYGMSDPRNLRWDAAGMLVDLLSNQDRVGIVPFSDGASPIFTELMLLDSEQRRENLRKQMEQAKSSTLGNSTHYIDAIAATERLLNRQTENRRAVIFLTDGLPNDATPEAINQRLKWFRDQGIPIYFLWLTNTRANQTERERETLARQSEAVRRVFETTGPLAVKIDNPIDIAYAFVRVVTDLQPGTYLDVLSTPVRDQANSLRFEAKAGSEQLLAEAAFIFVSNQALGTLKVTATAQPPNATVTSTSGPSHSVITSVSNDQLPINGAWSFTTNAADTVAFAFLRSGLKLDLVYPGTTEPISRRGLMRGEPALIGVRPLGVPVGQGVALQASLIPGGCPARQIYKAASIVYQLNPVGLSADSSVYWFSVNEVPSNQQRLGINVQMGQLDKPLRLAQCYDAQLQDGVLDAASLVKPTPSDRLVDGAIPVEVRLNPKIVWTSANAYVQAPDGKVNVVPLPLDMPQGHMNQVSLPGTYGIRVVAVGQSSGTSIALYRESRYEVPDDLVIAPLVYDLGAIDTLNKVLTDTVRITGPFLSQATKLTFGPAITVDEATGETLPQDLVRVDICDYADIQDKRAGCSVRITPAVDLPPGSYRVQISVKQMKPDRELGFASLKFTRQLSKLVLSESAMNLGSLEVTDSVLTGTLRFQSILWQGDPRFPSKLEISKLRRLSDQIDVETSLASVEMLSQPGTDGLVYDLVLRPTSALQPGIYKAQFALKPEAPHLVVEPSLYVVQFEIPAPGVYISFDSPSAGQSVWGDFLFIPGLAREFYLSAIVTTLHMTGTPTLALPEVFRVAAPGENTPFPASSIAPVEWRREGTVEGRPNQYRYTLVMRVVQPLAEGEKLIAMRMPDNIQAPREFETTVAVLGRTRAWWATGCPLVGLLLVGTLMVRVRAARRHVFTGTLTNANVPKLKLNLANYKQYSSIELTIDKQGNWGAKPSSDPGKVLIRCVSSSAIEITYRKLKRTLQKGTPSPPWTYR